MEGGERVVDARSWIRFRNYLRREDVVEDVTLRLMESLVLALDGGQLGANTGWFGGAKAGPGITMRATARITVATLNAEPERCHAAQ